MFERIKVIIAIALIHLFFGGDSKFCHNWIIKQNDSTKQDYNLEGFCQYICKYVALKICSHKYFEKCIWVYTIGKWVSQTYMPIGIFFFKFSFNTSNETFKTSQCETFLNHTVAVFAMSLICLTSQLHVLNCYKPFFPNCTSKSAYTNSSHFGR